MYFTLLIKSLCQVLRVLLFKAFFLYTLLFTGMYYNSKYYKQAKNKPGDTIVSDKTEIPNQEQIINKIDCYHEFKKNSDNVPYDLSIVLFQLHEQLNIPTEIINNIEKHLNIMQLKKNIIFLPFYDDFIKISRIYESNPPQYHYENNKIRLNNNLEARFYPVEPLRSQDKDSIIIFNEKDKKVITSLTLDQSLKSITDEEDAIITEIFNGMHKEINHFNEYTKLSYTDLIFIDRAFNATNYEEIVPILQWLPTIKSKQLEKVIWLFLLEKAGHFWNTITINNKNFWDTKDKKYIDYFIPKTQNQYKLIKTNRIPIPQHTLMLILKNEIKEKNKAERVIYKKISFKTSEINIFNKKASFSVKFPHKKDTLYINQYTFPYAWVKII